MNFCPLCSNILLIRKEASGFQLVCKLCVYFYPLKKPKVIKSSSRMIKDETIHDISL